MRVWRPRAAVHDVGDAQLGQPLDRVADRDAADRDPLAVDPGEPLEARAAGRRSGCSPG